MNAGECFALILADGQRTNYGNRKSNEWFLGKFGEVNPPVAGAAAKQI